MKINVNKKKLKKNKLFLSIKYRTDIFGNILRLQRINRGFTYVYFRFYKKLIKKSINIFFKLDQTKRYIKRLSKKLRHIMFRRKQIIFAFYQNMKIHQIRKLYIESLQLKGNLISNFITKLETRLDMFIYRAFNLLTLSQIKQLITHKKVFVNNKVVKYTSYTLEKYDTVSFFNYSNFFCNKSKMFFWLNANANESWKTFIYLYNFLLAKLKKPNRKFLICKHPKYIEVFSPLLIAILVEDKLNFKDVPFFFKMRPNYILNLFQL